MRVALLALLICFILKIQAQLQINTDDLSLLKARTVGPATTSGRICDIAVDPTNFNTYYIAAGYGGVWKTTNAGTTFEPIFDSYGTQSIGCITIDPSNSLHIWVGTGENNNQRSVGYGNGIYLSKDGGKSFTNMGLKLSEHIGMIKVDPTNSNIIYVAAYGPVWKNGGERGLYKTLDGGKTWKLIKEISVFTGCNEVHLDAKNPLIVYATFHQRQRKQWTYIGGGPESSLFKSEDGGATWIELKTGLPSGDKGRISFCQASGNSTKLYAMVETENNTGGLFLSEDGGLNWTKTNPMFTAGNYYMEIIADPVLPNRIWIMDTYLHLSEDGGYTVKQAGEANKHVDNHCIWVNPTNAAHWRVGCDGGLYETWDNGKNYHFKENLPITQFYRVALDKSKPFYHIYGGTQDNNTLGGPSETKNANGIANSDWYVTVGGDGFKSQVDPTNANIVYSQWQYGGLIRYDKATGNITDIKPPANEPLRWNWDAPLLLSYHNNATLYFCANKVFKSTDMGNSWTTISGDLTQQINRHTLPVMDKTWPMDAVAKDQSVSMYGNIIYFAESRLNKAYLAVGTDDGIVQITTNEGNTWTKCVTPLTVPKYAAITSVHFSKYNQNELFASWDNHKNGDFTPYLYVSSDLGKTWKSITNGLPSNGAIKSFIQDFKTANLLFCGTEFGLFLSQDFGANWLKTSTGLAPTAIMDMEIEEKQSDLVLATFGRGIAIIDNYGWLRNMQAENKNKSLHVIHTSNANLFEFANPIGSGGKGYKGASYFQTPNPEFGSKIIFNVKLLAKTLKEMQAEVEKNAEKNKTALPIESLKEIKAKNTFLDPFAMITILSLDKKEVRKIKTNVKNGLNNVMWDLRHNSFEIPSRSRAINASYLVSPGNYSLKVEVFENGEVTQTAFSEIFTVSDLIPNSLPLMNNEEKEKIIGLLKVTQKEIDSVDLDLQKMKNEISELKNSIYQVNSIPNILQLTKKLDTELDSLNITFYGDVLLDKYETERVESINEMLNGISWVMYSTTSGATKTHKNQLNKIDVNIKELKAKILKLKQKIVALQKQL